MIVYLRSLIVTALIALVSSGWTIVASAAPPHRTLVLPSPALTAPAGVYGPLIPIESVCGGVDDGCLLPKTVPSREAKTEDTTR